MADQKLTQLTALATLSADDLFYVVDDPAGAALSRKMAASVLDARYLQDAPSDGSTYGRNNAAWVVVGAGSTLPVADTQTIVKGSADATKLLRFEIDGFTAGATRVLTPPNQDTLLAGQNFANSFTVDQTYTANLIYVEPAPAGFVAHKFYAVDPIDPDAKLFNWNVATSDNPGSVRNNVVMNWGYNVAAGGGPEDDTDGCFYEQLETFYSPGAEAQFEYHWDFFLSGGADPGVRPMHLNCHQTSGDVDLYWFTDSITWQSAHDGSFVLLTLDSGANEAASQFAVHIPALHHDLLSFSGTTHAGLKLNSLTTTQQNALTPANGMLIYNTTTSHIHGYIGGAWAQVDGGGGGGTPGGADTQIQFNDGGSFGGDAQLVWDKTANLLTLTGKAVIGGGTSDAVLRLDDAGLATDYVLTVHADDENPYGFVYFNDTFGSASVNDGFSYYLFNNGIFEQASPSTMRFRAGYVTQFQITTTALTMFQPLSLYDDDSPLTNQPVRALTIGANNTSAAADGFGTYMQVEAQDIGPNYNVAIGRLNWIWSTATHASRVAQVFCEANYSGGLSEIWRGQAGASPAISFLGGGVTPATRQTHIADPSGGGTQDAEARTAINSILNLLEAFGFMAT